MEVLKIFHSTRFYFFLQKTQFQLLKNFLFLQTCFVKHSLYLFCFIYFSVRSNILLDLFLHKHNFLWKTKQIVVVLLFLYTCCLPQVAFTCSMEGVIFQEEEQREGLDPYLIWKYNYCIQSKILSAQNTWCHSFLLLPHSQDKPFLQASHLSFRQNNF